jgi:hypothetical protein
MFLFYGLVIYTSCVRFQTCIQNGSTRVVAPSSLISTMGPTYASQVNYQLIHLSPPIEKNMLSADVNLLV